MKRHDSIDLWGFAARSLSTEDARFTEEHLLDCPDCQTTLVRVQQAQGVLGDARSAQPKLKLAKADAALAREISRRLLKKARPVRWALIAAPLAVAGALLLGVAMRLWPIPEVEPVVVAPRAERAVSVEAAQVERTTEGTTNGGGQVASGETVSTGAHGSLLLNLPDTSRLRLSANSRVALSAVSARAIEFKLERGRVAAHAAHVPREAFTVRVADVTVHVLGTTFAVSRGNDWVEVAVSEGRVEVESPRGLPFFVSSGEQVRVGTHSWRPVSRTISGTVKDELHEVAPQVPASGGAAPAVVSVAARPVVAPAQTTASPQQVAAAPAQPEAPLTVPLVVTPLDAAKIGAPVKPEPAAELPPADWQPMPNSRAPIGLRGVAEPNVEPPAPVPSIAAAPARTEDPAPTSQAPAKADEVRGPMPEDLEELFLMRAERALRNGACDRYLLGLADIAEDPQKTLRQQRARIAMARCEQALGQPEAAAQEFARYIRDFPKGLFAREATAAAAAQPAVAK